MSEVPQVSFIVPSLNQGRFLPQCLDSIVAQELAPGSYEVWVIDGGSTDETLDILQSHALRPQWISEPDKGQGDAVNKGIQRSKGTYLCWINSDDVYLPGAIAQVLSHLKAHPEHLIVYGDADYIDATGELIGQHPVEKWDYARLADRCFICQPATIFHRRVVAEHGLLCADYAVSLDLEYWMRIGRTQPFHRIPVKIAASRLWADTKSSRLQLQMQQEAYMIGRRHTGKRSQRRLWSISENHLFKYWPGASRHHDWKGLARLQQLPFWLLKSLLYLRWNLFPPCPAKA